MKKQNVVKDKSYVFATKIVLFCKMLRERKEIVLSNQLLKSGTSIGANVFESERAESKRDFIHKLQIALKEANETAYWLRLMKDTQLIDETSSIELSKDCDELGKLLTSIIKTAKINNEIK